MTNKRRTKPMISAALAGKDHRPVSKGSIYHGEGRVGITVVVQEHGLLKNKMNRLVAMIARRLSRRFDRCDGQDFLMQQFKETSSFSTPGLVSRDRSSEFEVSIQMHRCKV